MTEVDGYRLEAPRLSLDAGDGPRVEADNAGSVTATATIGRAPGTGTTVITVSAVVADEPTTRLVDMLAEEYVSGEVVLDLSAVTLTSPAAIRALVAHLSAWADTATLRIVCSRLSARRLLRKWGGHDLPVYATPAAALRSLRTPASPPTIAIYGQCPKCRAWFACDDWFDHAVPLPCCPDCHLAPVKIDYRDPPANRVVELGVGTDAWLG